MAGGSKGNVKGSATGGMKAPPPPGQHPVKAATATATAMGDMAQGKSRQATMFPAAETPSKVLNQSKKMPFGPPAIMACGLAVVAGIAYYQISINNKMDETAAMRAAGKPNPRI